MFSYFLTRLLTDHTNGVTDAREVLEQLEQEFYPYEELTDPEGCPPGVDPCKKEVTTNSAFPFFPLLLTICIVKQKSLEIKICRAAKSVDY